MKERQSDFLEGKLPLPVGKSDWEEIAGHCYCVDKTLLIRDLLATRAGVALFTRPCRFGKTTAMQMLKCFFERRGAREENMRPLFESRAIARCENAAEWMSHQGRYPVIYLTFKDHKAMSWKEAQYKLAKDIGDEFARHASVFDSLVEESDRELFDKIRKKKSSLIELADGLGLLAKALHIHYKELPIVLVDEYDTPVTTASNCGYYEQMVNFMRIFLSGAMKDNNHVKMGILTGVLRVAKEGMLSGLNNLKVYTVFDENFSEYFGFTQDEVEEMARYYGCEDKMSEIRAWYDGYIFGGREMYNPWSVLCYFDARCKARPYWLDTSSNDLINEIVEKLPFDIAGKLLSLLKGESPSVPMTSELGPYQDIRKKASSIYALLVSAGYLKPASEIFCGMCRVAIPNKEVEQVYVTDICEKITAQSGTSESLMDVRTAFSERDPAAFKEHVERFLLESASYLDTSNEAFYHGLVLGMLSFMRDVYVVTSNRESGYGRFDIMLKPRPDSRDFPAVIIEMKAAKDGQDDLDALAADALRQIDEKEYASVLAAEGIIDVMKFGYAFCGKKSAICR